MNVKLVPVAGEHEEFLFRVFSASRKDEAALLPWDEDQVRAFLRMQFAAQQKDYGERFPRADHDLILRDDEPVGRLYVDRRDGEIRILDISVLPDHQGRGTGTALIQRLIEEGAVDGRPVRIWVEEHNRSYRLLVRLGFASVEQDSFLHLLERPSRSEAAPPLVLSADTGTSDRPASPLLPEGRSHETH